MIKKIKYILFSVMLFLVFVNVNAYTKEDIVNLASSINTCSSDTASLVNGFKVTYTRMINERDVSDENLTKIYNNISVVKGILIENNVCTKESLSALPNDIKDELYSLYKQTNKLITSSPKYVDIEESKKNNEEVQVVFDSSTNKIKMYEGGTLINVVESNKKLNYVGLNKNIIVLIFVLIALIIFMVILKIKGKKSIFITSFTYVLIFLLFTTLVFRNDISSTLDKLHDMSVKVNTNEKEVVVKDAKIISYPSYDSKYATIYINDKKENIYFGDSSEILAKGIGHTTTSSLPGEGKTTVLSGHNTGLFKELFDLKKSDKVSIETIYGRFTYKVVDSSIVEDTDINSIEKDYDLILYTCYPNTNIYGNKRLIIYLDLVDSEWLGDVDEN